MKKSFHSERREPRQESVMDVFGVHRRVEQAAMPFVAAALPVLAAAAAVDVAAGAVAKSVRTWRNYRPPRWKLLKCPKPEAVEAQWELLRLIQPLGPQDTCRQGSRLRFDIALTTKKRSARIYS